MWRKVVDGMLLGFTFVIGEHAAVLLLSRLRDRHLAHQPFGGKPPYPYWPR